MITALYSLIRLGEFIVWEWFWVLSVIGYFGIFSLIKKNRMNMKSLVLGFISVEVIFDILWLILFCFNSWYLEYGVGLTYGFYVWCPFLLIGGIIITVRNYKTSGK